MNLRVDYMSRTEELFVSLSVPCGNISQIRTEGQSRFPPVGPGREKVSRFFLGCFQVHTSNIGGDENSQNAMQTVSIHGNSQYGYRCWGSSSYFRHK